MPSAPPGLLIPVTADLGGLEKARLQARRFLESHGVDGRAVAAVELVLEEAVTNVLRYGYEITDVDPHAIEIDLQVDRDEVQLLIVDDARAFDPLVGDGVVLPDSLDEAKVGGLGLLMIRTTASRLRYERRDDHNRLALSIARSA